MPNQHPLELSVARLRAQVKMPYLVHQVMALVPVARPGLGTLWEPVPAVRLPPVAEGPRTGFPLPLVQMAGHVEEFDYPMKPSRGPLLPGRHHPEKPERNSS